MPLTESNLSEKNQKRVHDILEVIISFARLDFSKKTNVIGNGDALDAIGTGVNMLGEELETSTVSIKEKEQLLKEVHHRVKNNLQIVSSLLNLQSENALDKKHLTLIAESRNRINSIALVHEMLYASRDLSKIEIQEYIHRLCTSINNSFSTANKNITFTYNVEKNLFFDVDYMISIGLILNEIISNSFKYPFPQQQGRIFVSLQAINDKYQLCIEYNGIGLSDTFDLEKDSHLGMQLISMLSAQINGEMTIQRKNGTSYSILFSR